MAAEEIMIARVAVWLARTLGAGGSFTSELDTDVLGVRMPDELVTDPTVQAAGAALGDAGGVLTEAADALEAAVASGDTGELIAALAGLVAGLVALFDAARKVLRPSGRARRRSPTRTPARRSRTSSRCWPAGSPTTS